MTKTQQQIENAIAELRAYRSEHMNNLSKEEMKVVDQNIQSLENKLAAATSIENVLAIVEVIESVL